MKALRLSLMVCVATLALSGVAILTLSPDTARAALAGGLSHLFGYYRITSHERETITCATAGTQGGSLCVESDIETNDDLDVADDATITGDATVGATLAVTGASTFTGDLTLNGKSGALTVNGPIAAGPWFEQAFTIGASKGLNLFEADGTAYVTTADAPNVLLYGQNFMANFVTNTTATGTITPAGTATGLDLNAGAPGNSDEWTMSVYQHAGVANHGTTGGYIIPGTTPAWKACVTLNGTDVSEIAGFWLLVTLDVAHADLSSADPNYTGGYAGIGVEQTDIVVSDVTDGAVDTTIDAVDATSVEMCIYGSLAGVITYYVDGVNRAAAATHTLASGIPHIIRLQGLNHTGTEAPMNVVSLSLVPQ